MMKRINNEFMFIILFSISYQDKIKLTQKVKGLSQEQLGNVNIYVIKLKITDC